MTSSIVTNSQCQHQGPQRPARASAAAFQSLLVQREEPFPPLASFPYTLPLPAGTGDWAQLAPALGTPEPRAGQCLLPPLASPPGQASFPISPSESQGQRQPCHPTYFSRCEETTVCSENTLSNLGKGAYGLDDACCI